LISATLIYAQYYKRQSTTLLYKQHLSDLNQTLSMCEQTNQRLKANIKNHLATIKELERERGVIDRAIVDFTKEVEREKNKDVANLGDFIRYADELQ